MRQGSGWTWTCMAASASLCCALDSGVASSRIDIYYQVFCVLFFDKLQHSTRELLTLY